MFELKIKSPDALDAAARQLLDAFPKQRLFAFYGEMGAGKTTFIKAMCRVLKVTDVTSSPSFGLIHEYRSEQGFPVFHFDFYRIEAVEEVYDIGYEEYMYSGEYCFMEWPEHVEAILPENTVRIILKAGNDGVRTLLLKG
ncbi:tRNA (adenosine(37)-N6)-threonylcarbamoyltransferase complex ATPase subunit type 1 TsaE [Bacteroidota bacterium]